MSRGDYQSLIEHSIYKNAQKSWIADLIRCDMYWYELIANESEGFPTRKAIRDSLSTLQFQVKNELDKRFIYFIATRTKVRFSVAKQPRYSFFGNKLHLYVEIGKEKKSRKITLNLTKDELTGKIPKPGVVTTEKFITFTAENGMKSTFDVHDFLLYHGITLGIHTHVHYVGYTKNPRTRPINGSHAGLSDVLYRTSNEEHDVFIFYNLFKVTMMGANTAFNINFHVSNAMVDEIQVDTEGLILEKCLIMYFESILQTKNRENEKKELENTLKMLAEENKIVKVTVHYEMEKANEYFTFYSSAVEAKECHLFTLELGEEGLALTRFNRPDR